MHGVAQIGVTSATYQVPCAAHSHSPPHTNACCSQDEDGTLTSIGSQQVAHSPCSQARVYRALADIASKHSQYARPTFLVQSPSNPFAPPEIASGAAPSTSADIWRLGATLFFLVGEVIAQDAEAARPNSRSCMWRAHRHLGLLPSSTSRPPAPPSSLVEAARGECSLNATKLCGQMH